MRQPPSRRNTPSMTDFPPPSFCEPEHELDYLRFRIAIEKDSEIKYYMRKLEFLLTPKQENAQ